MDMASAIHASLLGLGQVLSWPVLGLLGLGVLLGAMVGVLPGLGGSASLAILTPLTFALPPPQAFALLIGVAAVVATTGDLTSILIGIPGEAVAAATVVDGYQMTRRGDAARALGASLASSLAGSLVGALTFALVVPFASGIARAMGSPELFMLTLFGVTFLAPLSRGSRLKGLAAAGLGVMLATVGQDQSSATQRFTFGQLSLWDGIGAIPLTLGLFAIPEIVQLAGQRGCTTAATDTSFGRVVMGIQDAWRLRRVVLQSSAIGTALGMIPGVGANIAQWLAYGAAARRTPEAHAFGSGAVEGVIAPSAANNATLGGSFVPALALGIPGGVLSALLLSALVMKGIVPGPSMLVPDARGGHLTLAFTFVWLTVLGNIAAVALACLALAPLARFTTIPGRRLVPILITLVLVGAFAERQSAADLLITAVLGAVGCVMAAFDWPRAPMLMGLVLAPIAENRLLVSVDAYGFDWLLRPGVLLIGAVTVGGLWWSGPRDLARDAGGRPFAREPLFVGILVGLLSIAFVVALRYPFRAAVLPAAVAVMTVACLLALLVSMSGESRRRIAPPAFAAVGPLLLWFACFIVLVWGLGFVLGAPVAVLAYCVATGSERLPAALLLAAAVFLFLFVVLQQALAVAFPPGVLMAAGIG